jgi:hypothetical protein
MVEVHAGFTSTLRNSLEAARTETRQSSLVLFEIRRCQATIIPRNRSGSSSSFPLQRQRCVEKLRSFEGDD